MSKLKSLKDQIPGYSPLVCQEQDPPVECLHTDIRQEVHNGLLNHAVTLARRISKSKRASEELKDLISILKLFNYY